MTTSSAPDFRKIKLAIWVEIDADTWELNYGTKDGIASDLAEAFQELTAEYIRTTGNVGHIRSVSVEHNIVGRDSP